MLGDGLVLVRREYPTDIGPVDLLCRDADGRAIAIEVKRRGEIDGVEQLARYVERLDRDSELRPVRGMFVAQVVRPQARTLAEARGLAWRRGRLRRAPRPRADASASSERRVTSPGSAPADSGPTGAAGGQAVKRRAPWSMTTVPSCLRRREDGLAGAGRPTC